ncbi:chemotaxis protein CheB [Noviherbaspirillum suwonense]|jgi:two-component system chemotaxis response regulator CheB|uniref:protein-glutamate methylesterase n=1 Tax=Noviherbaspirillum suwonense TaxID=1224511 RepID=A0ABY1Q0W1_9BURK|nr:chemotaxis protein CheB [Noviherbaspirillum suwonense]SMP53378.1 two-component system, chemotaxis family, response regulator CheB [Noviherbaspirillum suwonense]
MTIERMIVAGASAGGVESLIAFTASLPDDFSAPIFVVMHLAPNYVSKLPEILARKCPLPVRHPQDNEKFQPGHVYVAPPDHHMLIEDDCVIVTRGPKENRNRPSVDALFRSAAYYYREKVIGIVLSGALDDGTSGLWNIKRMGGIAIAQELAECMVDSMPASAMQQVDIDHVVSAAAMGPLVDRLVRESVQATPTGSEKVHRVMGLEVSIAVEGDAFEKGIMDVGKLSPFACPECHGVLVELNEGGRSRFRCHTGHAYSSSALIAEISGSVDDSYWKAMRGLEEAAMLLEKAGRELHDENQIAAAGVFRAQAKVARDQALKLRDTVLSSQRYSGDSLLQKAGKDEE